MRAQLNYETFLTNAIQCQKMISGGAGFLGCCVLLLIEITIEKRAIFLDNSVQEGRRNEVKP